MDFSQNTILERLIYVIKTLKLTGYEIAEKTPLSQVGVDKILNGTSANPRETTINTLTQLLEKNYNISKSWIETGAGEMKKESKSSKNTSIDSIFREVMSDELGSKLDKALDLLSIIIKQNNEIKELIESQRVIDMVSKEKIRISKDLSIEEDTKK